MDEARQAAYADEVARSAPLGGRGGLGLETGGVAPEKRKVSKAEKELLGSLKGHPGGLASMQTTVARAITHGNANFDPWKKPIKASELNAVNANKNDLYSHFTRAGVLTGDQDVALETQMQNAAPAPGPAFDKAVLKAVKRALKGNGGQMASKALRKSVVASLAAGAQGGPDARAAIKAHVDRAIELGGRSSKWSVHEGTVTLSRKSRRRA